MAVSARRATVGLYGNGRLVFRKTYGEQIAEEEVVEIGPQEIQRILRSAVDFGLAEWDLTRVQSKQIEKNNGEYYTVIPSDASQDLILISLLDYERGSYRVPRIERKIRFRGASFADRMLPSILEIRGTVELKRELYRFREGSDRRRAGRDSRLEMVDFPVMPLPGLPPPDSPADLDSDSSHRATQ